MNQFLSAPVTDAQRQRDALLGALVGLARSTVNEPKTEDTDRVLTSGLRLAADPDAAEDALRRMYHIVETEKHRVAPNCAICTMRCGNTDNYDLARLWAAPENIRALKLRLLAAVFRLAPLLSEFSAPGAEIWGCFFQKTLYKRQRNNYYISIVLPIVGTNRKRSD